MAGRKRKYTQDTHKYIAIDYDGTIVDEGAFPEVGEFKTLAIVTIKRMIAEGYKVGIWTARGGAEQKELVMGALKEQGVDTSQVLFNEHFEYFLNKYESRSPKIYGDIYIDDRAYGVKKIDWLSIHLDFFGNFNKEALDELTETALPKISKLAYKLNDLLTKA